jgi:hypothetical protein
MTLKTLNNQIIEKYAIENNNSIGEINIAMSQNGIFDNINEYELMRHYDDAVLDTIFILNQNPFNIEYIQELLKSCAIDEEVGRVKDAIKTHLNNTALEVFILAGLNHKWTRVKSCMYELLSETKIHNRDILLYIFLLNESNSFATRIGLLSLQKIDLVLAKRVATTLINHEDQYLRSVCIITMEM